MSELVGVGWTNGAVFFAFLRFSTFLAVSPFPGNMVPGPVRVLLAGGLALISHTQYVPADEVSWIRAALVEIALGLAMGFVLMLCLQAFALAGEVGGAQMGLANAGLGNPLAIDVNLMGAGYTFIVLAIFVVGDGPARMVILLQRSFELIPAGSGGWPIERTAAAIVGHSDYLGGLARLFFEAALHAASPLIAAAFCAQLVLAVLARAIPNLNWLVEGPSLTLTAGLVGLAASLETFAPFLRQNVDFVFEVLLRSFEV